MRRTVPLGLALETRNASRSFAELRRDTASLLDAVLVPTEDNAVDVVPLSSKKAHYLQIRAIAVMRQLASVLQQAHRQRVIHRDSIVGAGLLTCAPTIVLSPHSSDARIASPRSQRALPSASSRELVSTTTAAGGAIVNRICELNLAVCPFFE